MIALAPLGKPHKKPSIMTNVEYALTGKIFIISFFNLFEIKSSISVFKINSVKKANGKSDGNTEYKNKLVVSFMVFTFDFEYMNRSVSTIIKVSIEAIFLNLITKNLFFNFLHLIKYI